MIEHTSDVSKTPKITRRAQQGRAQLHAQAPPRLTPPESHTRTATSEPPPLENAPQMAVSMTSTTAPMAPVPVGTAASKSHAPLGECGQEPWQVAAEERVGKAGLGVGSDGHGGGRHALS